MSDFINPKILLVDDREDNVFLLESLLKKVDADIVKVYNGDDAVGLLETESFALVFCDIHMPGTDGYEVAKKSRQTEKNKYTPIVFLTAVHFEEEDIIRAYHAGAIDFVCKPFMPEVILGKAKLFLELYRNRQELHELKLEAEKLNKEKSNFIATVSHELRTPMNGIIGMNRLLLEGNLTEDEKDFAQTAIDSAESLVHLVNDVLDFSKLEAGKLELENIDFNLRSCLGKTAMLLAHIAQAKGVEMPVIVYHDVPKIIKGDPMRLRQVVLNLASNAVKYTDRGEVAITVEKVDDANLKISVRDTGRGIPKERLDTLFSAYTQVDSSDARKYGGTGLGLMIANKIVNSYGNAISVKSKVAEGSEFSFILPFEVGSEAVGELTQICSITNKEVVLLDSNKSNRRSTEEMLQTFSVKYQSFEASKDALEAIEKGAATIDAFILDLHISDMAVDKVVEIVKAKEIPIIVVTSLPARGDGANMVQMGVNAYLTKPLKLDLLSKTIGVIVNKEELPKKDQLITQHSFSDDQKQPQRILLVDDNPINQKVAVRTLEKIGYNCDVADNGQEAVDAVAKNKFDLVLMDCQMPIMNGYEATRAIRKSEENSDTHLKIYAMTASTLKEDEEACFDSGMDGVFTKPFDKKKLSQALDEIFSN